MADEIKKVNGTYLGRTLTGKKGIKKDGTEWIGFKYTFEVDMGNDIKKPWGFWGFGTTTGADTLNEGKMYCVGYDEVEKVKDGTTRIMKGAKWFGEPTSTPTSIVPNSVQQQPSTVQKVDYPIDEIWVKYISMREPGARSVSELLGLYLKTNKPDHPIVLMVTQFYKDITTDKSESL